jgi:hypothetical protein
MEAAKLVIGLAPATIAVVAVFFFRTDNQLFVTRKTLSWPLVFLPRQ